MKTNEELDNKYIELSSDTKDLAFSDLQLSLYKPLGVILADEQPNT